MRFPFFRKRQSQRCKPHADPYAHVKEELRKSDEQFMKRIEHDLMEEIKKNGQPKSIPDRLYV